MTHTPVPFPDGFLWGASTAAHQIEGNNTNCDWWVKEHTAGTHIQEPSLDACDSYHRWHEDMDLLAGLGFTDYRFSIEWARIEPVEGHFSRAELAHYRRMVEGALARGLRPMVTLHHFTVPQWFEERGGWTADGATELFARYVAACAPVISEGVGHVCTINEPNMIAVMAGQAKRGDIGFPPAGLPTPDDETTQAVIAAHHAAVKEVRALDAGIQVGWTIANQVYQARPGAEDVTAAYRHPREDVFIEAARGDDWIGVQSYTRTEIGPDGPVPAAEGVERTLTRWEYYPAAVGHALRHTAEVAGPDMPLIVTENGIATADDTRRVAYYTGALHEVASAIEDGLDVRGYLAWSALDNYEWGSFAPTFGLIAVDRETFERTARPSALWLGSLGRTRELPRTAG
ncbi:MULTISPECIES: family 1 glycosylhydrolase [unclassified Streptomyces]|uniref:glycoside hydrolase family 1 protein n=1 Tax=Streptomyces TaxID=1883 RepID=UPI0001C1CF9C|nr:MULTISPECIES: family 1 glycosylhydrolase [unclassified Streptomyces]AEN12166.1 glycoside hydrolase family 1 [Streptomyces sp. SirexAA-E]MYR68125.1 family 1 glycosylhydrolase [Streptomyces sp. SID4939]MYS01268.1 family 1 glycosylhydrolase [Streptomyces sp. SID4940]MYT63293.1 family 1 glycosylhydrolase [Streptomyces sp. SID8357]MYT88431.1 family 1 glycosylhydrolase [Streptomyces sp. SID8360]